MNPGFETLIRSHGGKQKCYYRGNVIYSNESAGMEGVYYILSGKIRIDISRVKGKRDMLVWLLGPDSFFGISSFYNCDDQLAYTASVASKEAEVLVISREEFILLLKEDHEFRNYIIRLLYRRMDYIETRRRYTSRVSFRKRMIDALLFLSPSHESSEEILSGVSYKIDVSPGELAQMLNATRKELAAELDEFCSKKIIAYEHDGLVVKNIHRLLNASK